MVEMGRQLREALFISPVHRSAYSILEIILNALRNGFRTYAMLGDVSQQRTRSSETEYETVQKADPISRSAELYLLALTIFGVGFRHPGRCSCLVNDIRIDLCDHLTEVGYLTADFTSSTRLFLLFVSGIRFF